MSIVLSSSPEHITLVAMLNRFGVNLVVLPVRTNEPDEYNPEGVVDVGNQSVLVPGDVKAHSAVT